MADRNLAKMIWDIAKADKDLDGLALRDMYKKKIRIDADEQREKLKGLVADHIQKNYQPVKNKMVLTNDMIIGGTANKETHKIRDGMTQEQRERLDNSIYAYKSSNFDYAEVTNRESRNLIKYAIIPLDLKWKLQTPHNWSSNIEISWDHWPEN